jgi:CheY-like chemotaxis protein
MTAVTDSIGRRVVLVVDDESPIRDLFARVLEFGGLVPALADNAESALGLINSGLMPDAILLDLLMPGMGGLGFLLQLRSDPRYAHIPVAIVTGDFLITNPMRDAVEALNAEIHFKPLEIDGILALTFRLLEVSPTN